MAKRILLPVPGSVSVTYVVAAPEHPLLPAAVARLRDELPAGIGFRIQELGGSDPSLAQAISRLACPDCSPEVDPLVAVLLERTDRHLSISCTAAPGWPPAHLGACARATDQIAELTGGIRLDAELRKLLPAPWRPSSPASPESFAIMNWTVVEFGSDDDGLNSMQTIGMARFGLPELRAGRLQPHHVHGWFHLVNGLSGVLVRRLFDDARLRPRGGVHAMPREISVSTSDVAMAGAYPPPDKSQRITVRLRHDAQARCLTVLPPAGLATGEARWRDRAALSMCGHDFVE